MNEDPAKEVINLIFELDVQKEIVKVAVIDGIMVIDIELEPVS